MIDGHDLGGENIGSIFNAMGFSFEVSDFRCLKLEYVTEQKIYD